MLNTAFTKVVISRLFCLSCYSGPSKFFGSTTPLPADVMTFFWTEMDICGRDDLFLFGLDLLLSGIMDI